MLRVTAFCEVMGAYTSQVFAGMYELRAKGEIELRFRRTGFPKQKLPENPHAYVLLILDSEHLSSPLNVCIDLVDGGGISSIEHLSWSDIYFKRSYREKDYAHLDHKKVVPFGLHYACTSLNEQIRDRTISTLLSNINISQLRTRPIRALKRTFSHPVKFALMKRRKPPQSAAFPMTEDVFDIPPCTDTKARIYYRTRVYSPSMAPKLHSSGAIQIVNDMRANTIRALKAHFGDRFFGGLRPTDFSLKHYRDCTMRDEIGFHGHLQAMQSSLVCVTTSGLFDSIDWKVPEYMAASRCIVSEQFKYGLPEDLVEGVHYRSFASPAECVAHCQFILDNPDTAKKMREAAYHYFQGNVKAENIMRSSLRRAVNFPEQH